MRTAVSARPRARRPRRRAAAAAPGAAEHPHVDMQCLIQPGHHGRGAALRQMRDALTTRGYFYASNVPSLPLEYIQSVYRYSAELHALPVDLKRSFVRPHGSYSGADAGDDEPAYEAGSSASVRSWDYSRTRFTGGDTAWPDLPSPLPGLGYEGFMDDLYARQDALARALMTGFADMLGLPSDTFSQHFVGEGGDMGTIRLLFYPGAEESSPAGGGSADWGISPHTDFEAFTLMHQSAPGLQFVPPGGGWVDAPVRPAEFVVIVGDVLERFTNGELRATPHRVLRTPWARSSIIRFNAVTPDTLIAPLPAFVTAERPAAYTPVTMQRHMDTTMRNLREGKGAWAPGTPGRSLTATYQYAEP
eukprot:TRINITY_DN16302_c0_g1_i1.p1 TRINITY_DN16302_c0_g1~~TRINITY_DN16302_c0_g1_i1.p1  ORF type:complete len:387 (+),score=93.59 TRINITY_DN16302_c0_g1_i1:81-1163(+)